MKVLITWPNHPHHNHVGTVQGDINRYGTTVRLDDGTTCIVFPGEFRMLDA